VHLAFAMKQADQKSFLQITNLSKNFGVCRPLGGEFPRAGPGHRAHRPQRRGKTTCSIVSPGYQAGRGGNSLRQRQYRRSGRPPGGRAGISRTFQTCAFFPGCRCWTTCSAASPSRRDSFLEALLRLPACATGSDASSSRPWRPWTPSAWRTRRPCRGQRSLTGQKTGGNGPAFVSQPVLTLLDEPVRASIRRDAQIAGLIRQMRLYGRP